MAGERWQRTLDKLEAALGVFLMHPLEERPLGVLQRNNALGQPDHAAEIAVALSSEIELHLHDGFSVRSFRHSAVQRSDGVYRQLRLAEILGDEPLEVGRGAHEAELAARSHLIAELGEVAADLFALFLQVRGGFGEVDGTAPRVLARASMERRIVAISWATSSTRVSYRSRTAASSWRCNSR